MDDVALKNELYSLVKEQRDMRERHANIKKAIKDEATQLEEKISALFGRTVDDETGQQRLPLDEATVENSSVAGVGQTETAAPRDAASGGEEPAEAEAASAEYEDDARDPGWQPPKKRTGKSHAGQIEPGATACSVCDCPGFSGPGDSQKACHHCGHQREFHTGRQTNASTSECHAELRPGAQA